MFIEQVFAAVIADKDTLRHRLLAKASTLGYTDEEANTVVCNIPEPLVNADAFLDKMTGLWRYEFGLPYDIADNLVWGTHMWVPVDSLFAAVTSASARLLEDKLTVYLQRLADPDAHQATLAETATT